MLPVERLPDQSPPPLTMPQLFALNRDEGPGWQGPPGYRFLCQFAEAVGRDDLLRLHPHLLSRPGLLLVRGHWPGTGDQMKDWVPRDFSPTGWSAYIPDTGPTGEHLRRAQRAGLAGAAASQGRN